MTEPNATRSARIGRAVDLLRRMAPYRPQSLALDKWPCDLCGHGHYPGERCSANGCECRA